MYQTLDWPRLQDPDGNPLPCPPKSSKYEVLDDDDRLDELDEYAIQVGHYIKDTSICTYRL